MRACVLVSWYVYVTNRFESHDNSTVCVCVCVCVCVTRQLTEEAVPAV